MTAALIKHMAFLNPRRRLENRGISVAIALSFLAILVVLAASLFPGAFTGFDPFIGNTADKLLPASALHWFGTDHLGRDMYARVIHGTWSSVTSAITATVIGLCVGGMIGLISGFLGKWVDFVFSRLVDVLLAIPNFLLAVLIVSSFGFQTMNVAIASGVSAVAVFARLMRSEVLKARAAPFVEASALVGGSRWHILLHHILPNAYRSVLALAVLQFGSSILTISALAFLGYGDPPPASDWGLLIANGKDYPSAPWLVLYPSLVVVAVVLAFNRIGRWIRQQH